MFSAPSTTSATKLLRPVATRPGQSPEEPNSDSKYQSELLDRFITTWSSIQPKQVVSPACVANLSPQPNKEAILINFRIKVAL